MKIRDIIGEDDDQEDDDFKYPFEQKRAHLETLVHQGLKAHGLSQYINVEFWQPDPWEPEVELHRLSAVPTRQGNGTQAMQIIVDAADSCGFDLTLQAVPTISPGNVDVHKLIEFYGRFGFVLTGYIKSGPIMRRLARR